MNVVNVLAGTVRDRGDENARVGQADELDTDIDMSAERSTPSRHHSSTYREGEQRPTAATKIKPSS